MRVKNYSKLKAASKVSFAKAKNTTYRKKI